ncbi:MAG TPA: tetratricopeptide repeat protein [Verrucomicrobiae bacterium]|nr:tetratricopeptide repeat protein [Verrucomicrobiae bacterium]
MNEGPRTDRWLWIGGFVVVLLTVAAHFRGLWGHFLEWDDYAHITQNPAIRSLSLANLWTMFTQPVAKLYIPLTSLSFALDYQIWGRDPFGYHFTNLLLHTANTVLVLILVFQLLRDRFQQAKAVAVLTAAIFGVHPLRVESVAWATERKDVLFAFFYLLALLAYLQWVTKGKRSAYWTCLLLFIASALSKSAAVTFPFVLILLDIFWKRRNALWEKAPFFAVCLIVGAATFVAQASGTGETVLDIKAIPIWARLGLVGYCALFYVGTFLWPLHLSAVYPTFEDFGWTPLTAMGYLLAFCGVFVVIFFLRKRAPVLLPSWLFYLITLSPTIGLVPVGAHVVADRFTYVPLIGLALPLSVGVVLLASRERSVRVAVAVAAVAAVAGLTFLSAKRSAVWANSETLFQDALAEDPACYTALVNLTAYYMSAGQLDKAIDYGQRAVALAPRGLIGRKNLAFAFIHAKRYREAIETLRPAVEHGIDDPNVWRALHESFAAVGDKRNAKIAEARMLRSTR